MSRGKKKKRKKRIAKSKITHSPKKKLRKWYCSSHFYQNTLYHHRFQPWDGPHSGPALLTLRHFQFCISPDLLLSLSLSRLFCNKRWTEFPLDSLAGSKKDFKIIKKKNVFLRLMIFWIKISCHGSEKERPMFKRKLGLSQLSRKESINTIKQNFIWVSKFIQFYYDTVAHNIWFI